MKIIKLDAIDSTNTFLRQLSWEQKLDDFTIVIAASQTAGKGQMGTVWDSEKGKNLTFSVFKKISCLENDEGFYISIATSLAIYNALKHFQIPKLTIKWPNDILSENQKICGILIENVIQNSKMTAAIIGIGLNVNQTNFEALPNATSLKQRTGIHFDLDEVMFQIAGQLKKYSELITARSFEILKMEYESLLFRKDKPSTFKDKTGNMFMGFIQGVADDGKLNVLLEDEIMAEFDLKEIKLLY
ncbi:biotin--[acetyl-CoA-carboxylase] ligase [Kordia algicida OT-1]|uniref:Putative biotin/lipoate A/B protein ligase family protein n=1 Tax=Kordia algicida OT-1 TaxID=391587 RepID=A9E1G6_9FLAO|nr:biotin--[acetyl-CoA-carboxylase] ligase [Kordia algicida]EDP95626.1 putative biotin/lipoate A/B protein ligase family protein [Kordia algicida OT-1]